MEKLFISFLIIFFFNNALVSQQTNKLTDPKTFQKPPTEEFNSQQPKKELPSSIFITIGAIMAAIIAGLFSFANLSMTKDQQTSSFRQKWIDSLRRDLAEYYSLVSSIEGNAQINEMCNLGNTINSINEFKESISKLERVTARILMRLNPNEHIELITIITSVEKRINNIGPETFSNDLHELMKPFLKETQHVLKKEWNRVKSGEPSFKKSKYFMAGVTVLLALLLIYLLTKFYYFQ